MTLAQRESPQEVQAAWQAYLRDNAQLFRTNQASPRSLHILASLYFEGRVSGEDRLRQFLGDGDLVMLTLDAFAAAPSRPDVPSVQEASDLRARNEIHPLALPLLAGLEERSRRTDKEDPQLSDDRLQRALTIYAFYRGGPQERDPVWHQWAVAHKPRLVAETIVFVYRHVLRCNRSQHYGLYDLSRDPAYAKVARLSVPSLLRAFPARGRADQLEMLAPVLAAALSHCDEDEFCEIVDAKLAAKSMGAQQRMYWLSAGLLRRPAAYLSLLKRELEGGASQRRVRYAGEFLGNGGGIDGGAINGSINHHLEGLDHIDAAGLLIQRVGSAWGPFFYPTRYPAMGTKPGETVVPKLIDIVAKKPGTNATALLQDFTQDPALSKWHERLRRAAREQRDRRRNEEFSFPSIGAVVDALAGAAPANASDLAALAYDEMTTLGREIRNGQTSDWRQYWSTECEPWLPQRENDCRDRLLSDLQQRLRRFNVTAGKEPSYADDKRADIRVSYDCFNVPIEIKLSSSEDLWSAIRGQLIPRYTRDPGAAGHGILLVFWFGQQFCRPKAGKRPASAAELRASLVDSLPPEVSRLVKVLVIDVEQPQKQPS